MDLAGSDEFINFLESRSSSPKRNFDLYNTTKHPVFPLKSRSYSSRTYEDVYEDSSPVNDYRLPKNSKPTNDEYPDNVGELHESKRFANGESLAMIDRILGQLRVASRNHRKLLEQRIADEEELVRESTLINQRTNDCGGNFLDLQRRLTIPQIYERHNVVEIPEVGARSYKESRRKRYVNHRELFELDERQRRFENEPIIYHRDSKTLTSRWEKHDESTLLLMAAGEVGECSPHVTRRISEPRYEHFSRLKKSDTLGNTRKKFLKFRDVPGGLNDGKRFGHYDDENMVAYRARYS